AGQRAEPLGHCARGGLAVGQRLPALAVPGAVAPHRGVGGVAEQLGLVPVLGRRLLQGVELALQRLALGLAPPRRERWGGRHDRLGRRGAGGLRAPGPRKIPAPPGRPSSLSTRSPAPPSPPGVPTPASLAATWPAFPALDPSAAADPARSTV